MTKFIVIFLSVLTMSFIQTDKKTINYIALGDSYTICTGTNLETEQWPDILSRHLSKEGIPTNLVINPSRNGFSTQNVIDYELPVLNKMKQVDLVTLLIGVNDWVREVDTKTFHKNLIIIIESVQKKLSNKNNFVLITIPDFGVTPQGSQYGNGRNISKGISEFNDIIQSEAKLHGLVCVDLFPISKNMKDNKELTAVDGLHPSAKEYAIWETLIFPAVKTLLKK